MASMNCILKNNKESHSKFYRICCAPGCRSNFTSDNDPVQTFSFPKDKTLRKKWLLSIKADKKYKLIAPQICIKHFEESFLLRQVEIENTGHATIMYPNGKVQLADNAIPTVFFNEQSLTFNNKKQQKHFGKNDIQYTYSKIEKTENFCRICLASNIRLTSLATVRKISANAFEIENSECGNLFEYLFALKTSDLPKWLKICFLCQNQLEHFFKFRKEAIQIHRNLMEICNSAKMMNALCKSSQEKYLISYESLTGNLNDDDSSLIENEWDETGINVFEDEYISGHINNPKSSDISNLSNLNKEIIEYFDCSICSKKYTTQKELDLHIINHNKQKNEEGSQISNKFVYACEYCSKEFYDQEILFSHRKEHYGKFENFVIKCNNCDETFNDRNHFNRHKIRCNEKNQKYFKCRYCLKKFFKYKAFQNHLQIHKISHNTHKSNYNTETGSNNNNCAMKTYRVSTQNIEEYKDQKLHENKNVTCQLCNVKYDNKLILQQHLYHDHLINYKFKCPFSTCQISFLNEFYLKNHIMDHQNRDKQNFLCDINEQILESKMDVEKMNFHIKNNNQAIVNSKLHISKLSDEKNCSANHVLNEIIEQYEVVLEELSFPSEVNGNFENYVELNKNEENFEYFEERDIISNKNGNVNLIYNENEDPMFEIDIRPEFY